MWLFTKYGFFSAVCARQGDGSHGQPVDPARIMVRARDRGHLEALIAQYPEQQEDSEAAVAESTPEDTGKRWFPDEVVNIQITCALRFRGYEYEEILKRETGATDTLGTIYEHCAKPVVESLTLSTDLVDAFGGFFALQRYLFKWGGEALTKYSREYTAFDFLFLHLYDRDVPRQYREQEYQDKWDAFHRADIEAAAAYVRKHYRREGEGARLIA